MMLKDSYYKRWLCLLPVAHLGIQYLTHLTELHNNCQFVLKIYRINLYVVYDKISVTTLKVTYVHITISHNISQNLCVMIIKNIRDRYFSHIMQLWYSRIKIP